MPEWLLTQVEWTESVAGAAVARYIRPPDKVHGVLG